MSGVRRAAETLRKMGKGSDKHLVHVNDTEMALLRRLFGGSTNPSTGLPQFDVTLDFNTGDTNRDLPDYDYPTFDASDYSLKDFSLDLSDVQPGQPLDTGAIDTSGIDLGNAGSAGGLNAPLSLSTPTTLYTTLRGIETTNGSLGSLYKAPNAMAPLEQALVDYWSTKKDDKSFNFEADMASGREYLLELFQQGTISQGEYNELYTFLNRTGRQALGISPEDVTTSVSLGGKDILDEQGGGYVSRIDEGNPAIGIDQGETPRESPTDARWETLNKRMADPNAANKWLIPQIDSMRNMASRLANDKVMSPSEKTFKQDILTKEIDRLSAYLDPKAKPLDMTADSTQNMLTGVQKILSDAGVDLQNAFTKTSRAQSQLTDAASDLSLADTLYKPVKQDFKDTWQPILDGSLKKYQSALRDFNEATDPELRIQAANNASRYATEYKNLVMEARQDETKGPLWTHKAVGADEFNWSTAFGLLTALSGIGATWYNLYLTQEMNKFNMEQEKDTKKTENDRWNQLYGKKGGGGGDASNSPAASGSKTLAPVTVA